MPVVKSTGDGFVIVSRYKRRYVTHQVSDEGVTVLQDHFGEIDGVEIDVPSLMALREAGHAFTKRSRWLTKRHRRNVVVPTFSAKVSPPKPAPAPATSSVTLELKPEKRPDAQITIACERCSSLMPESAKFCAVCGWGMGPFAKLKAINFDRKTRVVISLASVVMVFFSAIAIIHLLVLKNDDSQLRTALSEKNLFEEKFQAERQLTSGLKDQVSGMTTLAAQLRQRAERAEQNIVTPEEQFWRQFTVMHPGVPGQQIWADSCAAATQKLGANHPDAKAYAQSLFDKRVEEYAGDIFDRLAAKRDPKTVPSVPESQRKTVFDDYVQPARR